MALLDELTGDGLRDHLAARLRLVRPAAVSANGLKPAAVAIAVSAEARFLFTLRSSRLNRHGGQYALPGGRVDPGETAAACALRELAEELGVVLDEGAVIGRLDDFPTRSGYRITPVVVWAEAFGRIVPDPSEVAEVYQIPLAELNRPEAFQQAHDAASGERVNCLLLPTLGHRMYAPSAAILHQFGALLGQGRHVPVAHFEQPVFARK